MLAGHILNVTKLCINRKNPEEQEVRILLRERIHLGNESVEQEAIKERLKKWEQYQKTKDITGEVLVCVFCGILLGFWPVLKLIYRTKTIYAGAEYEVRQMQSVIIRHISLLQTIFHMENIQSN